MPPARLVTDTSLDDVARRLRCLGFDVSTIRGARLEELFEAARREGRTVITLSGRHPRRFSDIPALVVPRGDPATAVRAVDRAYEPSGEPFSRCTTCNTALQRRHPLEARGEVPGNVLRRSRSLTYCATCGKWYWEGSHVDRVREWLESVLGRQLAPPAGSAPSGPPSNA
jgi:uncharacterized protein with PIN domain